MTNKIIPLLLLLNCVAVSAAEDKRHFFVLGGGVYFGHYTETGLRKYVREPTDEETLDLYHRIVDKFEDGRVYKGISKNFQIGEFRVVKKYKGSFDDDSEVNLRNAADEPPLLAWTGNPDITIYPPKDYKLEESALKVHRDNVMSVLDEYFDDPDTIEHYMVNNLYDGKYKTREDVFSVTKIYEEKVLQLDDGGKGLIFISSVAEIAHAKYEQDTGRKNHQINFYSYYDNNKAQFIFHSGISLGVSSREHESAACTEPFFTFDLNHDGNRYMYASFYDGIEGGGLEIFDMELFKYICRQ